MYPPWIEVNDRQSNFDETTGKFVVASDDAVIDGVKVGRYLQTYSKRDLGPRFGFAYDLTGNGKTIVRGGFGVFWNFTPGGTSSSKAQNPPFLQSTALNADPDGLRRQPAAQGRPAGASGRRSDAAGGRLDAVDLRHQLPRRLRAAVEPQRAARRLATNYMVEIAYVGSQGRQMLIKGDPEPGAAGRRRDRLEREPSVHRARAGAADDRPGPEQGHARLQRAAA